MTEEELDAKIKELGKRCCDPNDKGISKAVDKNTLYAMRFVTIIANAVVRAHTTFTNILWRSL